MSRIPCWCVDAFTDRPFSGNPAVVCLLGPDDRVPTETMQAVAAEMNLSETAFVQPLGDGNSQNFGLRWFTPQVEVDLCGHATLATANALWTAGVASRESPLAFQTRSGWLHCSYKESWIELDFPALAVSPITPADGLLDALGFAADAPPVFVGLTRFDHLVECATADQVRALSPNMPLLSQVKTRGVIVTARSDDPRYDLISRFFAPAVGVPEDPVCGSAHCALTPYWCAKLGRETLQAYQASNRGGVLRLTWNPDRDRVVLGGQAVVVWQGELVALS